MGKTNAVDLTLVSAFERVAEAYPTRIALDSGTSRMSYATLNAAANRAAHRLIRGGGQEGARVALLMAHDVPAIAALAGILKAGRIVVALSPADPVARLEKYLADVEPTVIVTDAENRVLADQVAKAGCEVLALDTDAALEPEHNLLLKIDPEQTASIVFTSGSTGRPKGVMKTHRQICRDVAVHTEAMDYCDSDRIPLFSMLSTGQGTTGVWCALLNGARLCPFSVRTRGVTGLAEWIGDRGLTVYVSSASIFRAFLRTIDSQVQLAGIRAVRLASESATENDVALFRRHFPPGTVLVHTLSSSETGNIAWSRWANDDRIPEGRLPVGHWSKDIDVLLIGDDGDPVPDGEMGEIAVKSRYVAAGYWRDPELTSKRFSEDIDGSGTRLVRTGDWGRINALGFLEYCGRKDDRIKIRGNRIELTDIEWALSKIPGVEHAAAVAIPRENHEPMLVAFVVTATGASWSMARLRHAVGANLPSQMIPSRFVFVDRLPIGPGGKVDREALRAHPLPDGDIGQEPRRGTEVLLSDIWAEALDLPRVGRDDDFFGLGGDSLTGAIVAAHIYSTFEIQLDLAAIADYPTVSELASFIDECKRSGQSALPPIAKVAHDGPMPLSILQERIWRVMETRPGDVPLGHGVYDISGPIDVEAMKECLDYLVHRHQILRTTFPVVDGQPVQIIHHSAPFEFSFIDVSDAENPQLQAESIFLSDSRKALDPARLPMSRHLLIKFGDTEHWLVRTSHPLTHDGWSSHILMNEFATLYEARVSGMDPPIPRDIPLQFIDYAVWHRAIMQPSGRAYTEMLNWWKGVFSKRVRATRLPFKRAEPARGIEPSQGVIRWKLDDAAAERLNALAREAGVTHFITRLACFVALVADMTGRSTVVLGTSFANRRRLETRTIVGPLTNLVPLVLPYSPSLSLRDWFEKVRNRVFETEAHAELPFEELYDELKAAGLRPPLIQILFNMSADLRVQRIGDFTVTPRHRPPPTMPWRCQVYIDERMPENCRVDFDASYFHGSGMRSMVDRYLRLLEVASRRPNLSIGRLVALSSDNPIRRAIATYLPNNRRTGFSQRPQPG